MTSTTPDWIGLSKNTALHSGGANGEKRTKALSVRQVLYIGADETASSQLKIQPQ
ncbi:MAG: hypothetical protein PHG27_03410 [Massilibacteroides sp.]|nr:hypothetical protein [Massilibacteroides sp.]MDD3061339.1 hypothetical protein [Massilibacteroides sp.]MDD4114635.1 hypothetical protein [Massilibacteroides sp.]